MTSLPLKGANNFRYGLGRSIAVSAMAILCHAQAAVGGAGQAETAKAETVVGMTTPFREATLASVLPARIADIPVSEGALIAKGQLVVALEDGVQAARVAMAKAESESDARVELARVRSGHADLELARLAKLNGQDHASSKETDDARTAAQSARLELEIAKVNHAQAQAAYRREREILGQYRIVAPFSGYVAKHLKHAGESVDHLEGIVRLVQLNPIVVSVDCPLVFAPEVATGDALLVVPADHRLASRKGTVVFANRVADAASQTFKVKLSVDNADAAWRVGMKVLVRFGGGDTAVDPVEEPAPVDELARDEGR